MTTVQRYRKLWSLGIFLMIFLFHQNIYSTLREVVSKRTASSFIKTQQDSLLERKFANAKKLFDREEYQNALRETLDLINLAEDAKENDILAKAYFLAGEVFEKTQNFQRAIDFFVNSLKSIERTNGVKLNSKESTSLKVNDTDILYAKTLLKLGGNYHRLKETDSILNYKDSSLHYYNKVVNLNSLNTKILSVKAKAYNNISGIYLNDSLYVEARNYALKAVEIHKSTFNKVSEAAALGNLASIHLLENDFEGAKRIYFRALSLIENNNSSDAIEFKEDLYYNFAYALYKLKDYTAYDYQELSYSIKDDLRDKEFRKIMRQIDAENNVERAEREGREKTLIASAIGLFILIILLATIAYFKFRQKNLSLQISRNELIQQQKIDKLKAESQTRILNAIIDGKESERKEIAETLHDSVSALLSSANLHLQACKTQFNGTTPVEVQKTQHIINEASHKIRDLSHTLVSSVLLKFGLKFAIKDLAEKYSNSTIDIQTEIADLGRYDQKFEIKTYNIIQEFINNILKHSEASVASIQMQEDNDKLILHIDDNGKGFDITKIPEKDGLGINQIEARIKMMKGIFEIDSRVGKGTAIYVELPILKKEVFNFSEPVQ